LTRGTTAGENRTRYCNSLCAAKKFSSTLEARYQRASSRLYGTPKIQKMEEQNWEWPKSCSIQTKQPPTNWAVTTSKPLDIGSIRK
jgi:hypothetical protein